MNKISAILILILCCLSVSAQKSIIRHIVQSGETVESISRKYGVSKADIVGLNPTVERYLYTGQELSIPLKLGDSDQEIINVEKDSISEQTVSVRQKQDRQRRLSGIKKLPFMVTQGIGLYTRPNDIRGRYWGFSITLFGVGKKFSLSDNLLLQGSLNLEIDYQVNNVEQGIENSIIDATYIYKKTDFSSSLCLPLQCGVSVGSFIIRGGLFGRYTWSGKQSVRTTYTINDITNEENTSKRYNNALENVDLFTYGLTFDITSSYYKDTQEGLNIRIVNGKHMKRPVALFSFIIYY